MDLKSKGFSDVSCKVAVDYERHTKKSDLILDKPPVWCAAYGIFTNGPSHSIVAGEDSVRVVTILSGIKGLYHFDYLEKIQLEDKSEDYRIYSVSRNNNIANSVYIHLQVS